MPGTSDALGQRFRAAREARGLSLSAIEDESWSTIGAPVYIRGFLRTYARFLGIDPEEAVAAFNRTLPPPPQSLPGREAEAPASPSRRSPLLILIASIVAVV